MRVHEHDQSGTHSEVSIPVGDTLQYRFRLFRYGVVVDPATITLDARVYADDNADSELVTTLVTGSEDSVFTIIGGSDLPIGTYWWAVRDATAGVTVISGPYAVTRRPTS